MQSNRGSIDILQNCRPHKVFTLMWGEGAFGFRGKSFAIYIGKRKYDVLCQQRTILIVVCTLWRDCPQQLSKKNVNKDNAKFGYQISYLFSLFITFLWDISCYFITNPSKITRRVIAFTNKIHPYLECCYVIWEKTNLLIYFNHSILTKY